MKLGIIVLPDSNEELTAVLAKLKETLGDDVELTGMASDEITDDFLDEDLGLDTETETLFEPTLVELKVKLTEVNEGCAKGVLKEILVSFGAKKLGELSEEDYAACYAAAVEALGGGDDDGLGLDDDLDSGGTELDPEEVKKACQAKASTKTIGKDKVNAVLKVAGLNSVRGVKNAPQATLAKVMAGLAKLK